MAEHIGRHLHEVIPEIASQLEPIYREVLQSGQPALGLEVRGMTQADPHTERDWLVSYYPVASDDGTLLGVGSIVQDITDRKLAEEALRESEERFRSLSDASFEGIAITDHSRLVAANAAFLEMFGYDLDELTREEIQILVAPQDREMVMARIRSDYSKPYEHKALRKDGSIIEVEVCGKRTLYRGRRCRITAIRDITERKRAEEKLRASEEQVRLLLNLTAEAIYGLDVEGNCTFCNSACLCMLGYESSDQLLGKNMHALIHHTRLDGSPYPEEECRIHEAFKRGVGNHVDDEVLWRKDGTSFPAEYWSYPIVREGRVVGSVVTFQDITERKRVEEILRTSEARYRAIVEDQTELIARSLADGTLTFVNQAYCRYFGKNRDELVGHRFTPLVHPEDESVVQEHYASLTRVNRVATCEHRVIASDGEVRWNQWTNRAIFDESGRLVEFQGAGRDITDRKRAEEMLHEREEMIRALVETSRDWIWAINARGKHTYCNPAIEEILGYRPDEMVGRHSYDFLHDDDISLVRSKLPEWIAEKRGWENLVLRWRRKDGSWRHLESNGVPILDAQGELLGFRGVDRDITDRRWTEEKLRRMQSQLAHVARISTLGEMVAGIAHEVNQPLYSIRNFSQASSNLLSAEEGVDLAELREWNAGINKAAAHAAEIVKGLRGFARRIESQRSFCRINEILDESVQLIALEARRRRIAVRWELQEASPVVHVDRVEIQQVLVNLLQNACEAMDDGDDGVREVTICTEITGKFVDVSVADSGPGVSTEGDLHVFDAFVTTKEDGLGMGLAIATTIVEAHGGKLWATSNRSGGATFRFTLTVMQEG